MSASDDPHGLGPGAALDEEAVDAVAEGAVLVGGGGVLLDDADVPASEVTGARDPGGLVRSPRPVPASADDELDSEPLECDEPTLPDDDEPPQPLDDAPHSAAASAIRSSTRETRVIMVRLP